MSMIFLRIVHTHGEMDIAIVVTEHLLGKIQLFRLAIRFTGQVYKNEMNIAKLGTL